MSDEEVEALCAMIVLLVKAPTFAELTKNVADTFTDALRAARGRVE